MSISNAMNTAVTGLRGQSTALAVISENIANASTYAYKTRNTDFLSLVVSGTTSAGGFSSGGVTVRTSQDISRQGQIQTTTTATNVAVSGQGFFVVSDAVNNIPSAYTYSRNGTFRTDANGFLINNEGNYLLGWRTDAQGVVTALNSTSLNSLDLIDTNTISGTAQSTTSVLYNANLPADAVAGFTRTTAYEVIDNLGLSHTINMTWTKGVAPNTWTLVMSNPTFTSTGLPSGTISAPGPHTVTFNGTGSLAGVAPAYPLNITLSALASGSSNVVYGLNLGTVGLNDGLTQFASNQATPNVEIFEIDQNGVRYGQLSSISVNNDGIVEAFFDNGLRQAIYQLPVATFENNDGLIHVRGTSYDESFDAGTMTLNLPGQADSGTILASALEQSTTDTSEEFNKMIVAQQGYSAAAQVISTSDEMFQTLLQAVS